jgi:hypothetical protein
LRATKAGTERRDGLDRYCNYPSHEWLRTTCAKGMELAVGSGEVKGFDDMMAPVAQKGGC